MLSIVIFVLFAFIMIVALSISLFYENYNNTSNNKVKLV